MRSPFVRAAICGFVSLVLMTAAVFALLGPPHDAEGAGEALARLFALNLAAAAVAGYLARRQQPAWGWGKLIATHVLIASSLLLLTARKATADAEPMLHAQWPADWKLERLAGASADPRDAGRGFRLRATRFEKGEFLAAIEATCLRRTAGEVPALDVELGRALRGIADGLREAGLDVVTEPPRAARIGNLDAVGAELVADGSGVRFHQQLYLALTAPCLLALSYSANEPAFAGYRSVFDGVRGSLRVGE